jgi:hypothetical protein
VRRCSLKVASENVVERSRLINFTDALAFWCPCRARLFEYRTQVKTLSYNV